MAEFQLDTASYVALPAPTPTDGARHVATYWSDLDAFTQGYIEAAFFTEQGDGTPGEGDESGLWVEIEPGLWSNELGFADLAPGALADMIADCAAFQAAHDETLNDAEVDSDDKLDRAHAGRDFWYTRNGHGCGFWDGDWPEPYASELTTAAKGFGEVNLMMGDDDKVHCF